MALVRRLELDVDEERKIAYDYSCDDLCSFFHVKQGNSKMLKAWEYETT
jgi:hypothetical protein